MHNLNKFNMADIEIKKPISFELSIIDVDENLPSLKIFIRLEDETLKGKFKSEINFWLESKNWDSFVYNSEHILIDMNGVSRIKIEQNDDFNTYELLIDSSINSRGKIHSIISKIDLTADDLSLFLNQFKNYPKWW